ncbi:methyl-accepting chemotaxis protein [Paenibacillus sp. M1]|uniref:Methyl-accepting chemotaxis protein n=1 Tax=Paenibacillus haidiansis TaxID=1574488 RepID=A0ABU7VRH7_9BACL
MKLRGHIQFKSVGMKIFVILFVTVVLLSAVLGFSSYFMSKEIIRGQVGLAASQAIEQAADKLDFLFTEYESISRQLAVDDVLRADLETVSNPGTGIIQKTEAETRIKNKLNAMKGSDERLAGIRLVNQDLSVSYATSGATAVQKTDGAKARVESIYAADGKPLWIPGMKKGFFESTGEPMITMGRLLQNLKRPEAEFVLLIEIKDQALADTLSNLKIGKSGEVRILTADNTIVHAADRELIETNSYIGLDEERLKQEDASFTVSDENGVRQLAVYRQLQTVDWRLLGYAPESDFTSAADKLIYVTLFVLLLAVLVALLIGYSLIRMVGRPLEKLCRLMEEGERGNLQVRTRFKGRDEIGRLGHSFNRMLEQISHLVDRTHASTGDLLGTAEQLSEVSRSTSRTAGEIAAATGEIAQGAASLAEQADKGAQLSEEIESRMSRVARLNTAMDDSAGRVVEVSRQGQEHMEQLVEKTATVSRMTGLIEENSAKLKQSTFSIRDILAPMIEVTKQTNILSLNASIEASRAGTAGKGFMVIAEEIRRLAAQSNDSIQSVAEITGEIQEAIEETVNVLLGITPMIEEQMNSVTEASSIFQKVSGEMESFIGEIQSSSASVKELLVSQTELRDFIASVSSVVQQTNASTEEVAAMSSGQHQVSEELVRLSGRLEELAETLKQSLGAFQVKAAES